MSDIDLSGVPGAYVIIDTWGNCHACGKYDDLRYGSCFYCADYVMTDESEAWDIRNPLNRWSVKPH